MNIVKNISIGIGIGAGLVATVFQRSLDLSTGLTVMLIIGLCLLAQGARGE